MISLCKVDNCNKTAKCRGLCSAHYERWRHNGTPGVAGDARKRPVFSCSIDGCAKAAKARTWCLMHWTRWSKYGDPTITKRPTYGSGRVTSSTNGYVRIWLPTHPLAMNDGYVFEHRMVLHDAGEDLVGKHVHHKDEDKENNVIGNLETKTNSEHHAEHHPVGSKVRNQYGEWTIGS